MQYSIVKISEVQSQLNARLDAEYWHPEAIEISKAIGTRMTLGSCIKEGYRVVYENTEILKTDEAKQMNFPKFIQATDINSPMINIENAGYVCEEDWQQYPKGRIRKGEILLEVKGNVKKVAIVPEDFPDKVLVSGTLYKFSVNENINKYFLAIYLSCSYGQRLKDRLVSNIATPFINKSELYTIPVPHLDKRIQSEIEKTYALAVNKQRTSQDIYTQAQNLLLSELGLTGWQPKHRLTFVKNYSDIEQAERIDAEYYQPKYEEIDDVLVKLNAKPIGSYKFLGVTTGQYCPNYVTSDEGRPYLRGTDLSMGSIEIDNLFYIKPEDQIQSKQAQQGDVVVTRVGTIGLSARIPEECDGGTISDNLIRVRILDRSKIDSYYLSCFLGSEIGKALMLKNARGSVQQRLNQETLKEIMLPIPEMEVQSKIKDKIIESFNLRKQSRHLLGCAKRAVEIAIEQDEPTAIDYLENDAQ